MVKVNDNYLKLPGSYLFSTIGKKVREYKAQHPEADIISLGIGDVTQPIAPAVISALHSAVDEMGRAESFRGYAPDLGYDFLREAIAEHYRKRGIALALHTSPLTPSLIRYNDSTFIFPNMHPHLPESRFDAVFS